MAILPELVSGEPDVEPTDDDPQIDPFPPVPAVPVPQPDEPGTRRVRIGCACAWGTSGYDWPVVFGRAVEHQWSYRAESDRPGHAGDHLLTVMLVPKR